MTYYDLLKQYVSTGSALSEYQFDGIKKDGQLLNSYFYSRNKVLEYGRKLEYYEVDFIVNNPNFLSKLSNIKHYDIDYIIRNSSNKDLMIDKIINAKGNTLDSGDIEILLDKSSNPNSLIDIIIDLKGDKLDSGDILWLLYYSIKYNKGGIIDKIIKLIGYSLDKDSIKILIRYSSDKEKTKNLLIQAGVDREKIPE